MTMNLERINVRRDSPDMGWLVWIPTRGPMVNHIPLHLRYEVEYQAAYTPEELAEVYMDAPQLGPFGASYWDTAQDAMDFVQTVMREFSLKAGATR